MDLARVAAFTGPLRKRLTSLLAPVRVRLAAYMKSLPVRILTVVLVGFAGALIGIALGGRVETPIGPADVDFSLRPAWNGGTTVDIPPLGSLHLDSHWGPVRLEARVAELHPEPARRLIENNGEVTRLSNEIGGQVRHGFIVLAIRAALCALATAFLMGLLVFRSWRRALLSTGAALAGVIALSLIVGLTFNPQAVAEPRYTGLLANAPQVVGDTRSIVRRFSDYRAQLAKLVGNVSRLYAATSTLPTYEPDPSTLRILHVSDIHLNPIAWAVIRQVSRQFQIDVIIDSGDLTDQGTKAEDKFADDISTLQVPYIFVRGNHDSRGSQRAVARQKNAIVLDGNIREVEGLRIYGVGDPRFTPDKTTRDDSVGAEEMRTRGAQAAAALRATGVTPDIVVDHDPDMAEAFTGGTPLILAGHAHRRSTKLLPTATRLFVQGSTGGAGMRGLEREEPTPIELSVLYFSRATHRLQGWDDLKLGGLGLTSAQIERHLEPNPDRPITPPSPTPTPTPSTPTTTTTPSTTPPPTQPTTPTRRTP